MRVPMYLALHAPESEAESSRRVWRQILALEQWPIEYRLFFLSIVTQQLQARDEPLQVVVWRFMKPKNLRHLAQQYATTAVDQALSWRLIQDCLRSLSGRDTALQAYVDAVLRQSQPLPLAEVRARYQRWDHIIIDFVCEYLDGAWPARHASASAAIAVLQVEVAFFRALLTAELAMQDADRRAMCTRLRALIRTSSGHDLAIRHAVMSQGDGITLCLQLLRL